MVLCGDINDFGGTVQDVENDYLKYNQDKNSLVSYRIGFHAEYTTARPIMEGLARLADQYGGFGVRPLFGDPERSGRVPGTYRYDAGGLYGFPGAVPPRRRPVPRRAHG